MPPLTRRMKKLTPDSEVVPHYGLGFSELRFLRGIGGFWRSERHCINSVRGLAGVARSLFSESVRRVDT
jgi:hypothetical protein